MAEETPMEETPVVESEAPVVEETPPASPPVVEETPPAADPAPVVVELVTVRAERYRLYNPYSKTYFEERVEVADVPLDSWLTSQIEAGFITRV